MHIPESLIRDQAGGTTFERGRAYCDEGLVRQLRINGNRVTAQVDGSELYNVTLSVNDTSLDGWCDCPAYNNWGFCKHCVAVALACNQGLSERLEADTKLVIDYLQKHLTKEQLIDILMAYISDDPVAMANWTLKAEIEAGARTDPNSLRDKIDSALPFAELWDYREVDRYFQRADDMLTLIVDLIQLLPPEDQLLLFSYAYERLNEVLSDINDSGDYCYLTDLLAPGLVDAFTRCNWSTERKFEFLMDALSRADDVYPCVPDDFLHHTPELNELFYQELKARWSEMSFPPNREEESYWLYTHIGHLLETKAKQEGNSQDRIDILSRYANGIYELERLCELYLENSDIPGAQSCIDKIRALESRENRIAANCADQLLLKLFLQTGQHDAALQLQWQRFENNTSISNYEQLLKLAQQTDTSPDAVYTRAEQLLINQAQHKADRYGISTRPLFAFYLHTKSYDKACEIADRQSIGNDLLQELAQPLFASNPTKGFDYMERIVLSTARHTGNSYYDQVAKLLHKLDTSLHKQGATDLVARFNQLVWSLRQEYKRRPNFIKRLDAFKID